MLDYLDGYRLDHRHNPPQTIVCMITSLGAGTIIYDYQTVRYVISDVAVYSAPLSCFDDYEKTTDCIVMIITYLES